MPENHNSTKTSTLKAIPIFDSQRIRLFFCTFCTDIRRALLPQGFSQYISQYIFQYKYIFLNGKSAPIAQYGKKDFAMTYSRMRSGIRKGPGENTQEFRKTIPIGGWGLTYKYTTQYVRAQCALNGTARRNAYSHKGFRSALAMALQWHLGHCIDVRTMKA